MAEYLMNFYRPLTDLLLKKYDLLVDPKARDMLAKKILIYRELPPPRKLHHSPLPSANEALEHARELLKYLKDPEQNETLISECCASLRAALLENSPLGWELGQKLGGESASNYGAFLDSLEVNEDGLLEPDQKMLAILVDALDQIIAEGEAIGWQRVGRPHGPAWSIVRAGCMVWLIAGRPKLSYTWNEVKEQLEGALPDFLRELLACCNGKQEQDGLTFGANTRRASPRRGKFLVLSDRSLKLAIIACSKDHELKKFLSKRDA